MAAKSKSKSKRSRKRTRKQNTESGFVYGEIITWASLAVSILVLISNFGLGGSMGGAISSFLFRNFGWVAYALPFLFFGGVAFLVANVKNPKAYPKLIAGILFVVLSCALLKLFGGQGGRIGSGLTKGLEPALGTAGAYVVVIIVMIICLVVITGVSFFHSLGSKSSQAYASAKERRKQRQKEAAAKGKADRRRAPSESVKESTGRTKEEETNRRSAHHVEGVSFDTTLSGKSPEMKEVKTEPPFEINREEEPEPEAETEAAVDQAEPAYEEAFAAADAVSDVEPVTPKVRNRTSSAYHFPPLKLLTKGKKGGGDSDAALKETAEKLQQILCNFGVNVTVTNVSCGPAVTRYELQPEMGVKVSKIVGLADDIKLNLAASDIRIEAPIPGKAAVGIEVPNKENTTVMLRDLLESQEFKNSASKITFAVGKDIGGKTVVADIAKMPHLLIAGATGSGKSVCINAIIMSILYKATPQEVRLIMIDPKVVELSVYNGIPHLMIPVVTDPKKAAGALNWAVAEMERRYRLFADNQVRDITGYNDKVDFLAQENDAGEGEEKPERLPQIVIIVDELADLMMVAPGDVESAICRLAQLARAAGLHLVLATQRPSVNVITGLIKANMPSRIAFAVSSGVDSRTIIDMNGAEKLLGKGDMLFYPSGYPKPERVQCAYVSDEEVQRVVDYLKTNNGDTAYDEEIVNQVNTSVPSSGMGATSISGEEDGRDAYFADAGQLIIEKEKASIGMLQRTFKIGFNRAARIMDQLCEAGVVGGEEGTKPRKILMNLEEFEQYLNENL